MIIKEEPLFLTWFERQGDKFLGDEKMEGLSVKTACKFLEIKNGDYPFIGESYPLFQDKAHLFLPYLKHKFDFENHEYFIGTFA